MVLHKLNIARLTHLEAGQLIKSSIKDLETAGVNTTTDTYIAKFVQTLSADTVLYDKGLLQIKKNEETDEVARLDRVRDLSIGSFFKQLDVFENTRNANKLIAFKSLDIVAHKYNGLSNLNYEAESNGIDNLLAEITNTSYASHIMTLNMTEFVEDIQQTNDEFKQKFSQRSATISSTEIFNLKLIRKATFDNYNKYIQYVVSLANVDTGNDYHKNILNIINQNRKYYSDLLARRQGGNDNPPAGGMPS